MPEPPARRPVPQAGFPMVFGHGTSCVMNGTILAQVCAPHGVAAASCSTK
jgi:hypothetical protein